MINFGEKKKKYTDGGAMDAIDGRDDTDVRSGTGRAIIAKISVPSLIGRLLTPRFFGLFIFMGGRIYPGHSAYGQQTECR